MIWLDVPGGDYEIGLRPDEARAFAELTAKQARDAVTADPDQLHPDRELNRLDEMWGNVDYLYAQLAHSMPAHHVTLPAFALAKTPVTLAHYTRFRIKTGAAPRATSAGSEAIALAPEPPSPTQPVTGILQPRSTAAATSIARIISIVSSRERYPCTIADEEIVYGVRNADVLGDQPHAYARWARNLPVDRKCSLYEDRRAWASS